MLPVSDSDLKPKLNRSLAWVSAAAAAVGVLDILAILLLLKFWVTPEEYGLATTVVTLFVSIEVVAELGMISAVIHRDDHTPERISTIFWLNTMLATAMYGVVYLAAPFMARLHGHEIIEDLFKVCGLSLLLRAIYAMPQALLKKQLRFKEWSLIRITANLVDFGIRIYAGLSGWGVWCFIVGALARNVVYAVATPVVAGWRPRFAFNIRQSMNYIKFGARASAGHILFHFYTNIDYQIVNIYFGAAALGAYRAAYELVLEPVRILSDIVVGVAFPAFSRLKANMNAVVEQYIAFTRQNLVVVLTFMAFILIAAEELLVVILKPEYEVAATAARILAIVGVLRSLSHLCPPLLDGLGRPDRTLRYQVVAAVVLTGCFVLFAHFLGDELGFMAVAVAWAVGYPLAFAVLSMLVFSMIRLAPRSYLRRIIGIPLCVLIACLFGLAIRWFLPEWLSPGWRLLLMLGPTFLMIAFLLAIFQNIHPRSILRSLR